MSSVGKWVRGMGKTPWGMGRGHVSSERHGETTAHNKQAQSHAPDKGSAQSNDPKSGTTDICPYCGDKGSIRCGTCGASDSWVPPSEHLQESMKRTAEFKRLAAKNEHYDASSIEPGMIIDAILHEPYNRKIKYIDRNCVTRACLPANGEIYSKMRKFLVLLKYSETYITVPIYSYEGKGLSNKTKELKSRHVDMMPTGQYAQKDPVPQGIHGFLETVPDITYDIPQSESWFHSNKNVLVRFDYPVTRHYNIACRRITKLNDYSYKKALLLFANAVVHNKFDPVHIPSNFELPPTGFLKIRLAASELEKLDQRKKETTIEQEPAPPMEGSESLKKKSTSPAEGSESLRKPDSPEKPKEVKKSKLDIWNLEKPPSPDTRSKRERRKEITKKKGEMASEVGEVILERGYAIPDKKSILDEIPPSQSATSQAESDDDSESDDSEGNKDEFPKDHFLYYKGHVSRRGRVGDFREFAEVPDNYVISTKGCARHWLM